MEFIVTSEQIAYERLPFGVEKHIRYSEDCVYTFYLNNSNMEIELKDIKGKNLITGDFFDKCVNLMPKECIIVKNSANCIEFEAVKKEEGRND